jgi:hypothetical protein
MPCTPVNHLKGFNVTLCFQVSHNVEGDIFLLDDRTIYIQGFSFDGQAPDVHFWSDGVAIPYYTR